MCVGIYVRLTQGLTPLCTPFSGKAVAFVAKVRTHLPQAAVNILAHNVQNSEPLGSNIRGPNTRGRSAISRLFIPQTMEPSDSILSNAAAFQI
jgi:hypothetical protein